MAANVQSIPAPDDVRSPDAFPASPSPGAVGAPGTIAPAVPEDGRSLSARSPRAGAGDAASADTLSMRYLAVRRFTEALVDGLAPEDMVVQSMGDVSPTKWHLAHTSWFFEQFLLMPHLNDYEALNPTYLYLFNSYYTQAGERHCRAQRGYISRPTVAEVLAYRRHVDEAMLALLQRADEAGLRALAPLIELGLNHEQQHQELMLTDIKHVFSVNPLRPMYRPLPRASGARQAAPLRWVEFAEGVAWIGAGQPAEAASPRGAAFRYDNEEPRHREFVDAFALASRPVTNGEYLEFMEDGGYRRPELWLSMGWATVEAGHWTEPFYWEKRDGRWCTFTLAGMKEIDPAEPACHISYFEADAYARWAGARLPTEAEWEVAAATSPLQGNFVESGRWHPLPAGSAQDVAVLTPHGAGAGWTRADALPAEGPMLLQMFGDVWEWTRSQYQPYPGFHPAPGAVGEYNGKFMCNQFVLRGGSCATSVTHIRPTYRNFFPPEATWQFTGFRLAREIA